MSAPPPPGTGGQGGGKGTPRPGSPPNDGPRAGPSAAATGHHRPPPAPRRRAWPRLRGSAATGFRARSREPTLRREVNTRAQKKQEFTAGKSFSQQQLLARNLSSLKSNTFRVSDTQPQEDERVPLPNARTQAPPPAPHRLVQGPASPTGEHRPLPRHSHSPLGTGLGAPAPAGPDRQFLCSVVVVALLAGVCMSQPAGTGCSRRLPHPRNTCALGSYRAFQRVSSQPGTSSPCFTVRIYRDAVVTRQAGAQPALASSLAMAPASTPEESSRSCCRTIFCPLRLLSTDLAQKVISASVCVSVISLTRALTC